MPFRSLRFAVLALCCVIATHAFGQARFPGRLEDYLTRVLKLTVAERTALLAGVPLARNLDSDPNQEVAVFGAIWINAPIAKYVAAIHDIEHFESGGGFKATKKISEPARIDDFAQLVLPDDDIRDIKSCRVGDCELKISAEGLARVKKEVDFIKPGFKAQVERTVRAMAVDYVNAYRRGGNSELAVYRDGSNPTFVANEFKELVNGMPELTEFLPDMKHYLLEYPKAPTVPTTSFLYWQEAAFGLKPTIRINHVAIQEYADATVVASKQIYSSHYFWTALELRALVPDRARGNGFWFVNVTRSRSDGLSGFLGKMIRGKVRDGARSGVEAGLNATKKAIEAR